MPASLDPVELTKTLIQIPSESSNPLGTPVDRPEEAVHGWLNSLFTANGIECFSQETLPGRLNLIARFPRPGAPRVMITGHMDTVSARSEKHGFHPQEKEGRIYGRGACDDKGPLAVAICAILDRRGGSNFDVTFLATVGEEVGMPGASMYAAAFTGEVHYDLILGLEPTGLLPVTAHKGVFRFRLKVRGKSCHSSKPDEGINAINRIMPVIDGLKALEKDMAKRCCPRTGSTTLAVTQISGGTGQNVIPDACEICVDVRTVPGGPSDAEIEVAVASICEQQDFSIEPFLTHPPLSCIPSGPAWNRLAETLQRASLESKQTAVRYGTDCSYLQTLGPCVVWGPGSIAQAHTENEYIEIAQLRQACSVLSDWLGTLR